jgi:proteic killer suppression protein
MVRCARDQVVPAQGSAHVLRDREHGGVQASHGKRLWIQLAALDTAQAIGDMDIPGFRLHPLKGQMRGRWAVTVNGNWRLTFEFQDGNAYILDYEDYH